MKWIVIKELDNFDDALEFYSKVDGSAMMSETSFKELVR